MTSQSKDLLTDSDSVDDAERAWSTSLSVKDGQILALSTRMLLVAGQIEKSFQQETRRMGLSTGETLVLDTLRRLGRPFRASPTQLKRTFLLSFAGVAKRIARLEQLGYIVRLDDTGDGRSYHIQLTAAGLDLLSRQDGDGGSPHRHAMAPFSSEELGMMNAMLKRLQVGIDAILHEGN